MPGLSGRIATIVKATLSRLLGQAEKPSETLDRAYEHQFEELQDGKRESRLPAAL